MSRDLKKAKSIDLPESVLKDIPGALRSAVAILLDKKQKANKGRITLVYVIELPNQPDKYGKLIVDTDYKSKTGFKGNGVISGGIVARSNLKSQTLYEVIEGSL
ncbi:hypothetical protein JCM19239_6060 [Vibrio variabilis]|uniref:Uncharacterized protein n=1 Tax=Vibrio variabilis TaxID=990271 RepID=A0ABQ0JLS3_9VIBR|nr:hypothetical protein JCM19239_6060 [Vibrio variabilis]